MTPTVFAQTFITFISSNVAAFTIDISPVSLPSARIGPNIESDLASAHVYIDPDGCIFRCSRRSPVIVENKSTVSRPTAITADVGEEDEEDLLETDVILEVTEEVIVLSVDTLDRLGRYKKVAIIIPDSPAVPYFRGPSCFVIVLEVAPIV